MLGRLRALLAGEAPTREQPRRDPAPSIVHAPSGAAFDFVATLDPAAEFPIPRWGDVYAWVESCPEGDRDAAWDACEGAWLLHMRDALGEAFRLEAGTDTVVLSSLDPRQTRMAVEFMERTSKRIVRVLDGLAQPAPWRDLLILFDDPDTYYRYASVYHPDAGEFALSSGMYISRDRGHFITTKGDLGALEPVIAHEMTHACLAHLPLPLWLNEGLAVNTEHRVAGGGHRLHTPQQMRVRHRKFWGAAEVQEFWSGRSFRRPDDGNELSYDLARILVDQLSSDWPRFAAFARAASFEDAGAAAAREHLGLDLGDAVAALLETDAARSFAPDPAAWTEPADHTPEPA